ncbi:hypothetical protein [Psychroflexus sp. MES1-P1E]|uniref:hypothetical protein n=1 Tax=Psychroflexus sp. MES1-P1E TaxID=2058320 RepID=UPI000C7B52EE|nr:hypothetical protein [Psychroflexus sp. MES1-P1E]PKG44003.1 hypothetical protein CXF67_02100 [Psychroflexus sp. MES1-P1E]
MIKKIIYQFSKENTKHFIGYGDTSKMVAKYFSYNEKYFQTQIVFSLKIITKCDIQTAFSDIILYTPNQLGIPTYVLNNNPIRYNVSKGIYENIIDVSNYLIRFPTKGLFIVVNWINTAKNISNFSYHRRERFTGTALQPLICTYP